MHINRKQIINILYIAEIQKCDFDNAVLKYNLLDDKEIIGLTEEKMIFDLEQKFEKIDDKVEENIENYHFDRLNKVDKEIIRVAVYELMYTNLATAVIINEAVNLSKEFTETDDIMSSKFNNKLLDKIAKNVRDQK